jgi:hypothetical protein
VECGVNEYVVCYIVYTIYSYRVYRRVLLLLLRQYFKKPDDGDVNEDMPGALLVRVASSLVSAFFWISSDCDGDSRSVMRLGYENEEDGEDEVDEEDEEDEMDAEDMGWGRHLQMATTGSVGSSLVRRRLKWVRKKMCGTANRLWRDVVKLDWSSTSCIALRFHQCLPHRILTT